MLWSLVLVPLLLVLYVLVQRRRIRYAVRFTNLNLLTNLVPRFPNWRRHRPPALFLVALSVLLVGLARPQATVEVPQEGATVVMAMDTSGSMEATDVSPDRLSAAQEAAETFLGRMPEELRVGLVSFSSQAQALSLPTTEHAQVSEALDTLRSGGGTAMGDGLARATEIGRSSVEDDAGQEPTQESSRSGARSGESNGVSEAQEGDAPLAVILLSDGASTTGEDPLRVASEAQELGIPVFTVALGTREGVVDTPAGEQVSVPPDTGTLQQIADTTGGSFFSSATEADLVQVYEDLGSQIGFVKEEQEVTAAFVGAALAVLLAGGALSLLWFQRLP